MHPMTPILATVALEPNRWTGKRNPRMDLLDLLPAIKGAGFDQVEIWQWHVSTRFMSAVREIKASADALGIRFPYIAVYPVFLHAGIEAREEERIQADILDKAEILDTPMLKIMLGCGLKGGLANPEQLQLTAKRFGLWYLEAKAREIGMCAELHGGTMFDPVEAGERFMQQYPEFDFTICFQAQDFTDTDGTLALADRFAGRISHIHLQAPQNGKPGGAYDLLEEGTLDYRRLLPHILRHNPRATMTLEFVKDCVQKQAVFDVARVLANARRDAAFVEQITAGQ